MTSDDDLRATIARVRALLDKATPQNIDTAEVKEAGTYECPLCHADGYVDGKTFINYDGTASNVQFSGIGREHEDAEELFRALIAAAPALIDAAERAQEQDRILDAIATANDARNAALEEAARVADKWAEQVVEEEDEDRRDLGDDYDHNSYGAGYNSGAAGYSRQIAEEIRAMMEPTCNENLQVGAPQPPGDGE